MAVPKNALTTSEVARVARAVHRRRIRPLIRTSVVASRRLRGNRLGHLPDFLIVGVQKGGTTALFEELTALPQFGVPLAKEIHYFDRDVLPSLEWYRSHFWGEGLLWGESTPSYFDTPGVPARVASVLPNSKIIITLRDPVARAISQYYHSVDFRFERRGITTAFNDELTLLKNGGWSSHTSYLRLGYLARSRYAASMRNWLDHFAPPQLHVVVAEQRERALASATRFLLPSGSTTAEDSPVRDVNARPYQVPDDLDLKPVADLLREDAEELRSVLGWPSLPSEWQL